MKIVVYELDEDLNPVGVLDNVLSVGITKNATDTVPLLESASLRFDRELAGWAGGWYRIDALDGVRVPLGCYKFEPSSMELNRGVITVDAKGYSVLKAVSEVKLNTGTYIQAGMDAVAYVEKLLKECPGTIESSGACIIQNNIVFKDGTTTLEAAWEVLNAIGWCIRLRGEGGIRLEPLPSDIALEINAANQYGIQPGIQVSDTVSYTREFTENVELFDLVDITLPRHGLDVRYRVLSQNLTIDKGITVNEVIGNLEDKDK